jgi:LacI family transcriptional regulator
VPDDISVIGFDDSPIASNTFISLSTIRVYKREIGRYATQRIIQRINEPNLVSARITFPVQLIERNSCRKIS